jgi:3-phosphoshikimate 1-carboxyvinyltransferase
VTVAPSVAPAAASFAPARAGRSVIDLEPARALRGSPVLPGDKSISHRALMLGLLAAGTSRVSGASDGADVTSTLGVVRALGASVVETIPADGSGGRLLVVESPGSDALRAPAATLDCGNSGTTLRLFAGILAGQAFESVLDGDASLRRRPVARIIEPLRAMGAAMGGRRHDTLPPVRIRGRLDLRAIDWRPSVPSAQVKSAILLAGLRATGTTRVHEAVPTRDHTERMLRARGVRVAVADDGPGRVIEIEGGQPVVARDAMVPGDASAAAFWLVAGAIHPDAELSLSGVGTNPGRRTVIDLLREMGASIDEVPRPATGPDDEPAADLVVRSSELHGIDVAAATTTGAIDEIPVLCLAASQARGRTTFRGVGELRHKESDRIAGIVAGLAALGADVSVDGEDITVAGPTPLHGAAVDGLGDHRLVMTFAIAGLVASGRTRVVDAASAAISDPGFLAELERIRT